MQYFNFIHLGFEGYRAVALDDLKNARLLSRALEKSEYYTVLSDIHRKADKGVGGNDDDVEVCPTTLQIMLHSDIDGQSYEAGLPVVSFRFSDTFQEKYPEIQQKWIQTLLRAKGW